VGARERGPWGRRVGGDQPVGRLQAQVIMWSVQLGGSVSMLGKGWD
jgi:hypothetical protein